MNRKRKRRLKLKVRYDWVLFALLMLFLFASIIQKQTGLIRFRPLGGVIVATPKPQLSFETYRNNSYQQQLEKYASENFGLREPVIRIYNQYRLALLQCRRQRVLRPRYQIASPVEHSSALVGQLGIG